MVREGMVNGYWEDQLVREGHGFKEPALSEAEGCRTDPINTGLLAPQGRNADLAKIV